jgi:hypothetical protein
MLDLLANALGTVPPMAVGVVDPPGCRSAGKPELSRSSAPISTVSNDSNSTHLFERPWGLASWVVSGRKMRLIHTKASTNCAELLAARGTALPYRTAHAHIS